jgi:hypothetical protein
MNKLVKRFQYALVLLSCILGVQMALAAEIETTAVGSGADENAALADALAKAVAQVNGVRSSMNVSTGKAQVSEKSSISDGKTRVESQSTLEAGQTADARMSAQGSVSRYEILSTENAPDGRVKVTVKAFVTRYVAPTYNAPGSSTGRKRIAVFPAVAVDYRYDFFGPVEGAELSAELTGHVESAILATGRVSVLDRSTLSASLAELGLIGSSLTNANEKAKLRQLRGTDLIALATVREARHEVRNWEIASTGQRRSAVDMAFAVELRAVVPATGELLLVRKFVINDAFSRSDALQQASEQLAFEVVRALTGSAPPLPVRRVVVDEEVVPPPSGPRRSGITLPQDRR